MSDSDIRIVEIRIDARTLFRLLRDGPGALVAPGLAAAPTIPVFCDGLTVARVFGTPDGPAVAFWACADPSHGVHPRFAAAYDRIDAARARLGLVADDPKPCSTCNGSGWLDPDSDAARRQLALARAFGIWRGIPNPEPQPLAREDALLALGAFVGEPRLAQLRGAAPASPTNGETDGRTDDPDRG